MNEGQIKIDNKSRRINTLIPSRKIDDTFKSQADSDYEKKKREERKQIIEQLNRASS